MSQSSNQLTIVAAVNNELVLQQNLAASPCLRDGNLRLHCERTSPSAGIAYNAAIDAVDSRFIAFVHQDVYLPAGWAARVGRSLMELTEKDPAWAVAGVVGVTSKGELIGRSWSSGLSREVLGRCESQPIAVSSLDEIVVILRTDSRLRFDEALPGFHLYGTDIAQQAMRQRRTVYVIDAPVVHNSVPLRSLDRKFRDGYRFMQQKWQPYLPLQTCVVPITSSSMALWRQQLRFVRKRLSGGGRACRTESPRQIAQQMGYEHVERARKAA